MCPENDSQFENVIISKVNKHDDGWTITRDDGWSFHVPPTSPVVPKEGMTARFYGQGIGSAVRGLFLDGEKVFYRTAEEDELHQAELLYGATVEEWLDRWDAGNTVWSVEMGGLGPGYEQAIQITVAELVRIILGNGFDWSKWNDPDADAWIWKRDRELIYEYAMNNPVIKELGLSGAQYGAALFLAARLCIDGPIEVMRNPEVQKRRIQVNRNFT